MQRPKFMAPKEWYAHKKPYVIQRTALIYLFKYTD